MPWTSTRLLESISTAIGRKVSTPLLRPYGARPVDSSVSGTYHTPQAQTPKKRGRRRSLLRIGVLILLCYGLYGCTMMAFQDRFIFPRDVPGPRGPGAARPRAWEQA